MADTPTVAVLGTGTMGAGMARSMLRHGLAVRAWNRSPDRARPLIGDGATVVGTPEEATAGADVVVTMVSDTDAVLDVAGRALPSASDGAVWVQMGTIGIAGTEQAVELAVTHHVPFVDAPVSGTKQPAEDGELVVLVSGAEAAVRSATPVFDAVGGRTIPLGDQPGSASRLKVVVNTWLLELVAALGETISLAESLGVGAEQFLDAIAGGPLDTPYAQLKGHAMAIHEYPASFAVGHASKDAHLSLEAADAAGLHLPLATAVAGFFDAARGSLDDRDLAAIREIIAYPST